MSDKKNFYGTLAAQAGAFLDGETDEICAMANISALLFHEMKDLNWAGFYRVKGDVLVLGPFQGNTACTRIKKGKGVCGTAFSTKEAQVVEDVHAFPGHIACDCASNSEIVLPLFDKAGEVCAVLDIDSPLLSRFDQEDLEGLLPISALFHKAYQDEQFL